MLTLISTRSDSLSVNVTPACDIDDISHALEIDHHVLLDVQTQRIVDRPHGELTAAVSVSRIDLLRSAVTWNIGIAIPHDRGHLEDVVLVVDCKDDDGIRISCDRLVTRIHAQKQDIGDVLALRRLIGQRLGGKAGPGGILGVQSGEDIIPYQSGPDRKDDEKGHDA